MFNKHKKIKILAASLLLAATWDASAAMGGLQIQSRLNEPFVATVNVTGDEARALGNGSAKPTVSGVDLTATVIQQSADRAVVRLQSAGPVKEPVLTFWLGVGNQNRQYTAMLDPRGYQAAAAPSIKPDGVDRRSVAAVRQVQQSRRSDAERTQNNRRTHSAPTRVEVVTGSPYQVKDGELLVNIAERIQPEGMTLRQTINALVRANPRAFRNGNPDLMYRGSVLIIPEPAQLRRLASNPHIRVRSQAVGVAAQLPERNEPEQAAAVAGASVETVNEKASEPVVQAAVDEQSKPDAATTDQAVVSDVMSASAVAAASEEAATVEPVAVEEQASVPMPVSEVVVAASEQAVVEPETPSAVEESVSASVGTQGSTSGDWMPYALYGGGALLFLGGAYVFLRRRRNQDGERLSEESAGSGSYAVDDDIVFNGNESSNVVSETSDTVLNEDDLPLDLSRLAEQQHLGDTPETPTVSDETAEEDWSWMEDSGNNESSVESQVNVSLAEEADDDWLTFGDELSESSSNEETVAESTWTLDDAPASHAERSEEPQTVSVADDDWLTGLDNFNLDQEDEVQPIEPSVVSEETNSLTVDWDLGDGVAEKSVEAAETVQTAEKNFVPGFEEAEDFDFNLHFLDEGELSTVDQKVVDNKPVETDPFQTESVFSAEELSFSNEEDNNTPPAVSALPQEALEAKLELAKMYLEIDDANTARSTLMELIHEAEGSSIQVQAQSLLDELG